MATGTAVASVVENGCVVGFVRVAEGGALGNVEYPGRIPLALQLGARQDGVFVGWETLTDAEKADKALNPSGPLLFKDLSVAQKKAALFAAAKATRDAQVTPAAAAPAFTGTSTV